MGYFGGLTLYLACSEHLDAHPFVRAPAQQMHAERWWGQVHHPCTSFPGGKCRHYRLFLPRKEGRESTLICTGQISPARPADPTLHLGTIGVFTPQVMINVSSYDFATHSSPLHF